MREIMLSLKPHWAELIYSGKKTVEWRKSAPDTSDDEFGKRRIFIYETVPVKKVTGYILLDDILKFYKGEIDATEYSHFIEAGCVPYEDLLKYQNGGTVCAWFIKSVVKFEKPVPLSRFGLSRPPQSWQYLKESIDEQLLH